jgi:uncharacterized protein YqhQ
MLAKRQLRQKNNLTKRYSTFRLAMMASSSMAVGGQAVIEGVMMRSPHSMAVAVRKSSKKIIIKEFQWVGLTNRFPLFKKPVFRGMAMLVEAMMNGMQALSFSAEQASQDLENEKDKKNDNGNVVSIDQAKDTGLLTKGAIAASMVTALGMGVFMFVILPHLLTELIGRKVFHGLPVNTFQFHLVDGIIKTIIFISYITLISRLPDIKRVFQYHGAEHKSIFTYEHQKSLDVSHARLESRFHPRCGTSFLLTLIFASIIVFSVVFPLLPKPNLSPLMTSLLFALIKIPLMLPIVGLSYEFIRAMGKKDCPTWLKSLSKPGMWMQNLTTQEPDDEQLEVGLASLKACIWRENNLKELPTKNEKLIEFESIASPVFEDRLASHR